MTAQLLDRFGKGIRGAPRDTLVGELPPPEVRGPSFGIVLGSVVAFAEAVICHVDRVN